MNRDHAAFNLGAEPFFGIVMEGLKDHVDGEHFWDAVAEDAIFEFLYSFLGFANEIRGRKAYMDWFGGYSMKLQSADSLVVHITTEGKVVLEYAVHGFTPGDKPYHNKFCSIVTLKDRKIVHWRDYMDSLAVVTAMS